MMFTYLWTPARVPIYATATIAAALLLVGCSEGAPDWRRFSDACLQGDIVAANMELSKRFDGQSFNAAWRRSKSTPLHVAASSGRTDLVRQLLQKGVDPDLETENGNTALVEGAANGQLETVRVLLDGRAKVNRQVTEASSTVSPALFAAVSTGQTEVAKVLLDVGASERRVRAAVGGSLLFSAGIGGHDDTVALLLAKPASLPDLLPQELAQLRERRLQIAKKIEDSVCGWIQSPPPDVKLDNDSIKRAKSLYQCR